MCIVPRPGEYEDGHCPCCAPPFLMFFTEDAGGGVMRVPRESLRKLQDQIDALLVAPYDGKTGRPV